MAKNTETKENKLDLGKKLRSWDAPEFVEYQRSKNWFVIFGLVAAFLIALMIFLSYYVAAIAFFIGAVVWIFLSQRKPQLIPFAIYKYGISVGDAQYYYKDIEKFWVLYDPPAVKKIGFEMKKKLYTTLTVELEDEDPNEIRELLGEYMYEDLEKEEDATDMLGRILRF